MAKDTNRKLAAILSADVVGYSILMGADETGTLDALRSHRTELIEPKVAEHDGRVVKLMGDGILVEFSSAVEAVQCAVQIQDTMRARSGEVPEDRRISFRIGINIGDIVVEGDDIYGDGVNVAARLEGLAEPGGLCVSRNVFDQVKNKLDLTFEHQGDREVKNIAEPVSVYRVVLDDKAAALVTPIIEKATGRISWRLPIAAAAIVLVVAVGGMIWWQPWAPEFEPVDPATMEQPLPAKPSIAVLAFDDLSQGADKGYLSDAIAEGIITKLSHFSELFVIAGNSSFFYKGKATDVREIAKELGARYILEGSRQKAGDRIRVTVQLIDAVAGNHIWAETYDRDVVDIFALQDEIANTVASTVGAKLMVVAGEAAERGDPARLRAFEFAMQSRLHWMKWTEEGNEQSRLLSLKAIEADPTLPRGHLGLAWVYINGFSHGWTELDRDAALARARDLAQKGLDLDPDDYFPHQTMAYVMMQAGELDQAIVEQEKSLKLNPNATNVMMDLGETLVYLGRTQEAITQMERAIRRNPHHPDWFYWNLGWAQYHEGAYEDALATINKMSRMPNRARRTLAAIYVRLGQFEEARAVITKFLENDPGYTIEKFRLFLAEKFRDPNDAELWIDDLRKAGLPE